MIKSIHSYEDLLNEKDRLEKKLKLQKEIISNDMNELKQNIMPVINTFSVASKIFTRNNQNILLNGTLNWGIDLLFRKLILSKSGWLTKRIVPFFIKNFSSHFIAEHKEVLMEKLFSWIGHKNGNDQAATSHL